MRNLLIYINDSEGRLCPTCLFFAIIYLCFKLYAFNICFIVYSYYSSLPRKVDNQSGTDYSII